MLKVICKPLSLKNSIKGWLQLVVPCYDPKIQAATKIFPLSFYWGPTYLVEHVSLLHSFSPACFQTSIRCEVAPPCAPPKLTHSTPRADSQHKFHHCSFFQWHTQLFTEFWTNYVCLFVCLSGCILKRSNTPLVPSSPHLLQQHQFDLAVICITTWLSCNPAM